MVAAGARRSAGCARRLAGEKVATLTQQQLRLSTARPGTGRKSMETTSGTGAADGGVNCHEALECLWEIIRAMSGKENWEPIPGSLAVSANSRTRRLRRRRSGSSCSSSFESKSRENGVQGRLTANGANHIASLFTQQGKKGINQDAMIVWENFNSKEDVIFCGVFDGHGPEGHFVAKRVRDILPLKLCAQFWSQNGRDSFLYTPESLEASASPPIMVKESDKHMEMFNNLKESFFKAFKVVDKDLRLHGDIDCRFSGTTAVTLIKHGQEIIIGNLGDSRAVLCTRDDNDSLTAVQLTVDLKPNVPKELERIRRCNGRVFALREEPSVARVWLPNFNSPGLAMARAFGDFCLKDYGIISVPVISHHLITAKDEFIVLATDGVWDVLSNEEVIRIVASATARSSAAKLLVQSAVHAWRKKYPSFKVDDCAAVCLFLNEQVGVCSKPNDITAAVPQDASVSSKFAPATLQKHDASIQSSDSFSNANSSVTPAASETTNHLT